MTKWSARFALGLSSCVPGIRLHPRDIEFIPDTTKLSACRCVLANVLRTAVSPKYSGKQDKVPTELIMTDGCGLANREFFEALQKQFIWDSQVPTAVQVRLNGAKVSVNTQFL